MNRRLLAITAAAIGAVVLGWMALVWAPTSHRLHAHQAAANKAVRQRDQLKVELSRLQALQAKAAAEKAESDRLKAALPDLPSLDGLVLGLNSAAAQAGVDLTGLKPSPPSGLTGSSIVAKPVTPPATGAQASPAGAPAAAEPLSEVHFSLTALGGGPQLPDLFRRLKKSSCVRSMPSRKTCVPNTTCKGTTLTLYFSTWSGGNPAVLSVRKAILPNRASGR